MTLDGNRQLTDFLAARQLPGRLVFAKVWGSRSHNTEVAGSDWDFSGVYRSPTRAVLGLSPPPETVQNKEGQDKPDYSFHEVGKFCSLLLTGNPGILEMLFTDRLCVTTPAWDVLRAERRRFLSRRAVMQYVGYVDGQVRRLRSGKGREGGEKWAYHICRLLHDARRIAAGEGPLVWKEGAERDRLLRIRGGHVSIDEVLAEADVLVAEVTAMVDAGGLPAQGDREFLEGWLVAQRLDDLGAA